MAALPCPLRMPPSWIAKAAAGVMLAFVALGAALPAQAHVHGLAFQKIPAQTADCFWKVRRRFRRSRRWARHPKEIERKAKEETPDKAPKRVQEKQPDEHLNETKASPPPQPTPPPVAKANPPAPTPPAAPQANPEAPAQTPPPAPPQWPPAEAQAAGWKCGELMVGLGAIFERMPPFKEGAEGECGAPAPIRLKGLRNVHGPEVLFASRPVMTCRLAEALHRWLNEYVEPEAKALLHSPVVRITDLSAYGCRFVYNSKGEKISEHAVANAIDIGEFVTAQGKKVSVLDNWNSADERGVFLHAIHDGACSVFGTTLGPEANADHNNHFHLDMKERRHPLCDFTPEQLIARAKKQAQEAAQSEPPAKPPASTAEPKSPPPPAPEKNAKQPARTKVR